MQVDQPNIILLPGLDGTARLFNRFIAAAPPGLSLTPVVLPAERLSYEDLADRIAGKLPDGRLILIAESYSGPLAIRLAARRRLQALVLCNSFVAAPRAPALRWLARPIIFKLHPPAALLRRYMLGNGADDALLHEVAAAIASVPPDVLISRVRSVLSLKAEPTFGSSTLPVLYVRSTNDRIVPDSAWRTMSLKCSMRVVMVPGPHLLLQANPSAAWEAILPFIRSLPAASSAT